MSERKRLYRSRRGVFLGVCRGVAECMDVSVFWTRVVTVVVFFFTGLWPTFFAYLLLGFLLPAEPVKPLVTDEQQEFYGSYTASRSMAVRRLKRTYDSLSRRIRRMEDTVTRSEFDWDRRMNEGT
jgi:phage shock protein C